MTIQKTDALLLKKKDFRETSVILTFFTRDFGKIHGILKGVRGVRARSSVNPLFFSHNHIVYYEKKSAGLYIISQCEIQEVFLNILNDWDKVSVAYYILELVDVFTEPQGESKEIFENLLNSLKALDKKKGEQAIARLFEIRFLMALGLWPGKETFELTKGAMSTLSYLESDVQEASSKIKLTYEIGEEIKKITQKIITDNLDKPLKTLRVFDTV